MMHHDDDGHDEGGVFCSSNVIMDLPASASSSSLLLLHHRHVEQDQQQQQQRQILQVHHDDHHHEEEAPLLSHLSPFPYFATLTASSAAQQQQQQQQQQPLLAAIEPAHTAVVEHQPIVQMQMMQMQQRSSPYRTQLQRESHILAERQRREEMNEKFTILRSMIPKLTKKDKASIVTDTINYIRELEKKVSFLQAACSSKHQQGVSELKKQKKKSSMSALLLNSGQNSNYKLLPVTTTPMTNDENETEASTIHVLHKAINNCSANTTMEAEAEAEDGDKTGPIVIAEIPVDHDGSSGGSTLRRVKVGQVEIEDLGDDSAVIKIVSRRSHGLVLRLHVALQDCKVDVIQSNVTTVGDNMVHFITIRLNVGISATLIDLATSLQLAISSPSSVFKGFGDGVLNLT